MPKFYPSKVLVEFLLANPTSVYRTAARQLLEVNPSFRDKFWYQRAVLTIRAIEREQENQEEIRKP